MVEAEQVESVAAEALTAFLCLGRQERVKRFIEKQEDSKNLTTKRKSWTQLQTARAT